LKKITFILVFLFYVCYADAAVPTVQVSGFTYNSLQCNSVNLQWVNGNGAARIIIGKIGSAPDFVPQDGTTYSGNSIFGKSIKFGNNSDNFILYNSNSTNFVRVDSLLPCSTYYFTIYEHDNAGGSTKYLTTNPPSISVTTYCTKLDLDVVYYDSCQIKNLYKFRNRSTSTIPGIVYKLDFADGDSTTLNSATDSAYHSYKTSGMIPAKIKTSTSIKGCQNVFVKNVRVYQKKVVFLNFADPRTTDTAQCLDGNLFKMYTGNFTNPLSGSYGYRWFTDGDTSIFSFLLHSYKTAGMKQVSLEVTTNISKGPITYPTACKDTLIFFVKVYPSPVAQISYDTVQCLTNNDFKFNNPDNSLISFKWYFGDGDSSLSKSTSHQYKNVGSYQVIHQAADINGCKGKDTVTVRVVPDAVSQFTGLDTHYCSSNKIVTLFPNSTKGFYQGYPTQGDTLVPNLPGTYTLSYIVKDTFCSDTAFKTFVIDKSPVLNLRDTAQCTTTPLQLDAGEPGAQYLWNTGEITQKISVPVSGKYYVTVTEGKCSATDSLNVLFATKPKVNLGSDTILCKGGSLRLNAKSPQGNYQWSNGSKDSFIYAFSPGKYTVTVTNPCGTTKDSIYINFQTDYCDLFMANAFSPGNDLVNNIFMPRGRNITVKSFQIYNRWGELIFETDMDNVGWDGTYKGDYVQDGLYIWKLNYTTPNGPYIKKNNAFGQVLVIR
jgi:gliding motility-associated-like protein